MNCSVANLREIAPDTAIAAIWIISNPSRFHGNYELPLLLAKTDAEVKCIIDEFNADPQSSTELYRTMTAFYFTDSRDFRRFLDVVVKVMKLSVNVVLGTRGEEQQQE